MNRKRNTTLMIALAVIIALSAFSPITTSANSTAAQIVPTNMDLHEHSDGGIHDHVSGIVVENMDDLISLFADTVSYSDNGDGTVTITSNGVPDHPYDDSVNPNSTQAYNLSITVLAEPVYSETITQTGSGAIGIAVSGAAFFNPYNASGQYAVEHETLDSCKGHASSSNQYHYHGYSNCLSDDVDGQHSTLIGIMMDGFPIYGPRGENGEIPTDLDECMGHFGATPEYPDGIYHYHSSSDNPYITDCLHGEIVMNMQPTGNGPNGGGPRP